MEINVRAFPDDRGIAPFSGAANLSGITRWGEQPFPEPVAVTGRVVRRGDASQPTGEDLVEVEYTAAYTLHGACARCLAAVAQPGEESFRHVVVERLGEDDPEDWVEAPGGRLDMDVLAGADLLLSLEHTLLCREDCAGICPICGANRNQAPCQCENRKPMDPRFSALADLFED